MNRFHLLCLLDSSLDHTDPCTSTDLPPLLNLDTTCAQKGQKTDTLSTTQSVGQKKQFETRKKPSGLQNTETQNVAVGKNGGSTKTNKRNEQESDLDRQQWKKNNKQTQMSLQRQELQKKLRDLEGEHLSWQLKKERRFQESWWKPSDLRRMYQVDSVFASFYRRNRPY